jgi:A/G-specific adenine glycosylase
MTKRISPLLRWYKTHGRDLPWRNTREPYEIFMSEIMLQQTQVRRVIPFYKRWLDRFPDWQSLARARTDEVLRAWGGLGYNRRALYARDAAKTVAERGVPKTAAGWKKLKGVGPYTAAALHAFVWGKPAPAVDTNVRRVIGRAFLGKTLPRPSDDPRIARVLGRALNPRAHRAALYALMDLGALVCLTSAPACGTCPLRRTCKSAPLLISRKRKRAVKKTERVHEGKKFPDRIYRGRIIKLLRDRRSVRTSDAGMLADETYNRAKDERWMNEIIERLVKDRLIRRNRKSISLSKT